MVRKVDTGDTDMGEIIATELDLDVVVAEPGSQDGVPELGWMLSNEAEEAMRDIDASIRAAEQMSGSLVFG